MSHFTTLTTIPFLETMKLFQILVVVFPIFNFILNSPIVEEQNLKFIEKYFKNVYARTLTYISCESPNIDVKFLKYFSTKTSLTTRIAKSDLKDPNVLNQNANNGVVTDLECFLQFKDDLTKVR